MIPAHQRERGHAGLARNTAVMASLGDVQGLRIRFTRPSALVNSAPAKVGVGMVAGVTVYLGGAKILGVRELSMLLRPRRAPS